MTTTVTDSMLKKAVDAGRAAAGSNGDDSINNDKELAAFWNSLYQQVQEADKAAVYRGESKNRSSGRERQAHYAVGFRAKR